MDISSLLQNAILNPNQAVRADAEAQLSKLAEDNWLNYIGLQIELLANENVQTEIRMLAGLNVKNQLTSKDKAKKQLQAQRWITQIDDATKLQFKQQALNTLLSPDERVANQAASLVAAIAEIELPNDQWPDLIDTIVENTKPEKPENVKRASLLTIGYICESIDPNTNIAATYSNGILIAIVQGAQSTEESIVVRRTALSALVNSLEFVEANFQREGERNYIMQVICEATTSPDTKLQAISFGALAKVMNLYYDYMGVYMEKALYSLTVQGMKSTDEAVACMAVEFWSTVCEVELEISLNREELNDESLVSYNFALIAISDVLPVLLELLTKQNDDFEDDTWSISMAAAACLQLFAQDTGDYVVQPTLQFFAQNIGSDNWRNREAAVMAFGSILDGPNKNELKVLIPQALVPIFNLINDPELQVKETVSWCLGRITELVIESIDDHTMLPKLVESLINGLNDHPKVATNCCWSLINLFEQKDISNYLSSIIPALVQLSAKSDNEHSSRTSAYETLSSFVLSSSDDELQLIGQLAPEIMSRLDNTIKIQLNFQSGSLSLNAEDKALLEELQSNIISLLTNIIRRVGEAIADSADNLMTKFLELLQIQTADSVIEEDIFMAISAIANSITTSFEKYMPTFLPFLTKALETTETTLCQAAIGLIVDICHALGPSFIPYCQGFMTILGNIITNTQVPKELKPIILSCFGDIASSIGSEFIQYLPAVMDICLSAQTSEPYDQSVEAEEYQLLLQESVLNTYVGIVAGMSSSPEALAPYLAQIFNFLTQIYGNNVLCNNDEVCRAAVGMIGDLAQLYCDQKVEYFAQPWVTDFLKRAKDSRYSKKTRDVAKWAREQQKRAGAI